jgi:hypothetical protein
MTMAITTITIPMMNATQIEKCWGQDFWPLLIACPTTSKR